MATILLEKNVMVPMRDGWSTVISWTV
jgi:hypothetical protein